MKLIDIQNYLVKCGIVFASFFVLSAFTYRQAEKKSFVPEISVAVVQENDGFTVTVKSTKNTNIHFYLFTVDGRLSKELNIYGSKRINIPQLEKGIYIYDFFSNDERIKNGKIELR